jgi:hypothetical protein
MCQYFNPKELRDLCEDPTFCFVCRRNRNNTTVDEHHVCEECREGTEGMPRRLPTVTLDNGKTYFIDERLKQLRNVLNPHDYIDF